MAADDDKQKSLALTLKSATAAAGAILAFAHPGMLPLAVGAAVLPDVFGFVAERVLNVRLEKFFKKFSAGDATFENIEERIQAELLSDPHLAQTIWAAVRAVFDAFDDSVAPSLGALAAEYRQQKKPADAFFRGVTGVLSSLSADEVGSLRDLLAILDRFMEAADNPMFLQVVGKEVTGNILIACSDRWEEAGASPPHTDLLLRLLKAHALAGEGFGEHGGPGSLTIRRETVARLRRILVQ